MSDTPRTDAAQHNIGSLTDPHYVVDVEFARQLERESRESRDPYAFEKRTALMEEIVRLEREVEELRHDIDRAMANHNADLNAAPQAVRNQPVEESGSAAVPADAAPCSHPWRGEGPEPVKWTCCGMIVYRSYEDYCWD
jgi:hypothetical protein